MTDDSRKLLATFEKYRQIQRPAYKDAGTIDYHDAPTEDEMAGEDDQEAPEYLQAFVST